MPMLTIVVIALLALVAVAFALGVGCVIGVLTVPVLWTTGHGFRLQLPFINLPMSGSQTHTLTAMLLSGVAPVIGYPAYLILSDASPGIQYDVLFFVMLCLTTGYALVYLIKLGLVDCRPTSDVLVATLVLWGLAVVTPTAYVVAIRATLSAATALV